MPNIQISSDTLFLAATRPAMHWGVPMEGYYFNLFGTWLLGMIVGNPFLWLTFFLWHIPMVALSNKNPYFFHELYMWYQTQGQMIGNVVHAVGGKGTPSSV